MVRNWVSHRIRQKDDLSPITKGFHAFAKARTVAVYYGCADTVTGLAFGYIPEIIEFTKRTSII